MSFPPVFFSQVQTDRTSVYHNFFTLQVFSQFSIIIIVCQRENVKMIALFTEPLSCHNSVFNHIFCKNAISFRRIIDKHMCHRSYEPTVLQDR